MKTPISTTASAFFSANRYYISSTLLFCAVASVFTVCLIMTQQTIASYVQTQQQIEATTLTYQENDTAIRSLKKMSSSSPSNILPTQKTIIDWITQTETMAQIAGVTQTLNFTGGQLTKNTIVLQGTTTSSPPYLNADITLKGTYNQVMSYIALLDRSYYYTRIDSLSFSASGSSSAVPTLTPTPIQHTPLGEVTASLIIDVFIQQGS